MNPNSQRPDGPFEQPPSAPSPQQIPTPGQAPVYSEPYAPPASQVPSAPAPQAPPEQFFIEPVLVPQNPPSPLSVFFGRLFARPRLAMGIMVGLLVLGGGGVWALNSMNSSNSSPEGVVASADIDEDGYTYDTPEVSYYAGDGADITDSIPVTATYICADGYTKQGDGEKTTCIKTKTSTVSGAKYTCPSGYTKSGAGASTKCSKVENGTKKLSNPTSEKNCPAGYAKSGNDASVKCEKVEKAQPSTKYSCATGYALNSAHQCVKSTTLAGTVRCPAGYTMSSSNCTKTVAAKTTATYSCPSNTRSTSGSTVTTTNYTLSGSSCKKSVTKVTSAKSSVKTYKCATGYTLSGSSTSSSSICTKFVTTTSNCPSGTTVYSVSSDVTRNVTCQKPAMAAPTSGGYMCSPAASYKLVLTNKCRYNYLMTPYNSCPAGSTVMGYVHTTGVSTGIKAKCKRSSAPASYKCPTTSYKPTTGITASTSCKLTVGPTTTTITAIKKTSTKCDSGTLKDGKCVIASSSRICDSGYTKSGSSTSTKCSKITTSYKTATGTKGCQAGYALVGSTCEKKVGATPETKLVCASGANLQNGKCVTIVGGRKVSTKVSVSYGCNAGYVATGSGAAMTCAKQDRSEQKPKQVDTCIEGYQLRDLGTGIRDCVKVEQ